MEVSLVAKCDILKRGIFCTLTTTINTIVSMGERVKHCCFILLYYTMLIISVRNAEMTNILDILKTIFEKINDFQYTGRLNTKEVNSARYLNVPGNIN